MRLEHYYKFSIQSLLSLVETFSENNDGAISTIDWEDYFGE